MKKRVSLLAAVAAVGLTANISMAALSSSPIYQWGFDGGSGAPVTSGGAGGGVFSTTTGLTAPGAATYNNASLTGTDYKGAAGSNSYFNSATGYSTADLSSANSTALTTVPSFGGQITVTAWIRLPNNDLNNSTSLGKIFYIDTGTNAFGVPVYFSLASSTQITNQSPAGTGTGGGRLQVNINNTNPNFATSLNGAAYQGNISAGQIDTVPGTSDTNWHFVAFTFDSSATNATGNLNFYTATLGGSVSNIGTGFINATLADFTNAQTYATIGNNATTATSTALSAAQGRPLDGNIDDVRVYSGVASLTDLQAIATVPEPTLLGMVGLGGLALLGKRRRA